MLQRTRLKRFIKLVSFTLQPFLLSVLNSSLSSLALPNYLRWRRCVIRDNDQAQISNILGIATDILGRALCQRPVCHDSGSSISRSFSSCSDGFTILPKKVKIGQNKVVAMLNDPLEKDDVLKIVVEKSGELIEIRNFKCRNPYTVQFAIPGKIQNFFYDFKCL